MPSTFFPPFGGSGTDVLNEFSFKRLTCLSGADIIWKPRCSQESTSNRQSPSQGAGSIIQETGSSAVISTSRSQPKGCQNHPLRFYRLTVAGSPAGTHTVTCYRVYRFSLSLLNRWGTRTVQHSLFTSETERHLAANYSPTQPPGTEITSQ